jgi:hypothetical protein
MDLCSSVAQILAASAVAAAQACPDLAGAMRIESERYAIAYRTRPEKIAVGQHFAMDVVVCPRGGRTAPAGDLRVDAHMPEHRHGMNYRTSAKSVGDARYVVEGFMFHMPGRWEFIFDVRADGRTDRVTRSVTLD